MRNILIVILIALVAQSCLGQSDKLRQTLYTLNEDIKAGNKESLLSIAKYLDDKSFVQEFLGYHNYPNTARGVAIRIIEENCLFAENEFRFDSTISTKKFLALLKNNNVYYDDLPGQFLITPIISRKTVYELKRSSSFDLQRLDTIKNGVENSDWYYENQIDWFVRRNDPQALKWIASTWYKRRSRFNVYHYDDEEFLDLMKKLTRLELGVPDEKNKMTYLYNDDYYAKARLNYLIYWSNHYKDYTWNSKEKFFENKVEQPGEKSKEEVLFSFLNKDNDSLAMDAFIQLTELDTAKVDVLADEYEKNNLSRSGSLPTFPYRFLKQLSRFTQYCRENNINYKPSGWLFNSLKKLELYPDYAERYKLEDDVIRRLNVSELSAVEYYALIHQANWGLTYSAGRIIDKAYSKNWTQLHDNSNLLSLYLKKSKLFDDIGIIGNLNKFLKKFENCSESCLAQVKELSKSTKDFDVKNQALKVLSLYSEPSKYVLKAPHFWDGNQRIYGVKNLRNEYNKLIKEKKKDDKKFAIKQLIGKISYEQIGEAIEILKKDSLLENYEKYNFIEADFGFPVGTNDSTIKDFLVQYKSKNESKLYEYYLLKNQFVYLNNDGSLMYNRIYDMLKYDVVDAFAGGGGGRRDNCVYLLIKILELKFKTRLGYSEKLCSWQGMYACDCTEQAKAWMHYLEENKLVLPGKNEPVSIASND